MHMLGYNYITNVISAIISMNKLQEENIKMEQLQKYKEMVLRKMLQYIQNFI